MIASIVEEYKYSIRRFLPEIRERRLLREDIPRIGKQSTEGSEKQGVRLDAGWIPPKGRYCF
jgi:hypothetical protein